MPFSAPADEVVSGGFSAPDDEVIQPEKKKATWGDVPANAWKDVTGMVGGLKTLADRLADVPPEIMDRITSGDFKGLGSDALSAARKAGDFAGEIPSVILDRVQELTTHPIEAFKEHPVNTALDVAPFAGPLAKGVASEAESLANFGRTAGRDAVESVGKKALTSVLGPSKEAIEARMLDPEAIKSAIPSEALAERLPKSVAKLQEQVSAYDKLAWDTLRTSHDPLEGAIPKEMVAKKIDAIKNQFRITGGGVAGEADARAVAKLDAMKQRMMDLGGNVRGALKSQQGVSSILKNKDFISERNLKEIIQSFDNDINYNDVMAGQTNKAILDARRTVDGLLKKQNTAYAEAMVPVAKRAELLDSLPQHFNLKRELSGGFSPGNKTATNLETALKEKTLASRAALEKLKSFTGENYLKDLENAKNAKQFEGGVTQGSRRTTPLTVLGGSLGGTAGGVVFGPVGAGVGSTAGSGLGYLAGSFLDTNGRKIAGNIIDWYMKHRPEDLGRYSNILTEANKLGPEYLLSAHNLLSKSDPRYTETIDQLSIPPNYDYGEAIKAAKAYDQEKGNSEPLARWNKVAAETIPKPTPALPAVSLDILAYRDGLTSFLNGDKKAAADAWRKALQINPRNREAEMGLRRLEGN